MSASLHPPHSLQLLDALQTSLNAALLEIAYSMKNHARPELNHLAISSANPQNLPGPKYNNPALTVHVDRFHVSLDELERELFRAQSVLRRDVAVHRAAREAREAEEARAAAEEAQKQKKAQEQEEQEKKAAAAAAAAAQSKAATASLSPTMHRSANQDNDVTMTGTDAFNALPSTAAHTAATPKTLPNNPANKPLAVETSAASNAHTGAAPETAGTTTGSDDLFGRTPTIAGLNTTDLDSMFEDLTNDQDNGGEAGDGFGDNQQGEIDFALLPGLESYANIDSGGDKQQQQQEQGTEKPDEGSKKEDEGAGDMFDFGLGSTDQNQKQSQGQQQQQQPDKSTKDNKQDNGAPNQDQKQEQDQQQQQDADAFNPDSYANDSSFDDMFNYAEFDLGGDGAGDGTGTDTAFDDDFFTI
ncbi:hypothetical protein IWZ03DRAFT_413302 [Phyllosticta citriasiana]|uniref:Uncharacterized protein n=1 Tax=Phyllosticta citriasiana TaxID=595635 RepID=A0ABR1KSX0_9PEZI